MTQASRARASQPADATPPRRPPWAGPLVAGLAFGLAYGVTQRLVTLNVGELIRFGQGFDVQVFPGTTLESLRLRFGAAESELRGNLELQELERQKLESKKLESEKKAAADEAQPLKPEGAAALDANLAPAPPDAAPAPPQQPAEPQQPAAPPVAAPAAVPRPATAPPAPPRP